MRLLICTQAVDRRDPLLGFFHTWLVEFASRCERLEVICLRAGDYSLPAHVHVHVLPRGRIARAAGLCRLALSLRQDYDAVFVHMNPEYLVAAGWLWRLMHKRAVLWYTHKNVSLYLRVALACAYRAATASSESFRIDSPKVVVTGHGIDTTRAAPSRIPELGMVRLMTTGRIAAVKGIGVLIDAFLILKSKGVNASFSIYGTAPTPQDAHYQEGLMEQLRAAGVDPGQVFVGAVPHHELPARRAHADYLIHASETGSLDKTVLDAAMSGVIPVSSSEAYAKLFDGYADLLTYPKGDARALAARIEALEALPEERRQKIRDTLKRRVEDEHGLTSLIGRILSLYAA